MDRYALRVVLCGILLLSTACAEPAATRRAPTRSEGVIVRGIVVDARGVPIPEAVVTVYEDQRPVRTLRADEHGMFRTGRLPGTAFVVSASAEGYEPASVSRSADGDVAVLDCGPIRLRKSSTSG